MGTSAAPVGNKQIKIPPPPPPPPTPPPPPPGEYFFCFLIWGAKKKNRQSSSSFASFPDPDAPARALLLPLDTSSYLLDRGLFSPPAFLPVASPPVRTQRAILSGTPNAPQTGA